MAGRRRRGRSTSHVAAHADDQPWPTYEEGTAERLEIALSAFLSAATIADCRKPMRALMRVAAVKVSPLERSTGRSLWAWYVAWLDAEPGPSDRLKAQFALFADEYHDRFVHQANPMVVDVLGRATGVELDVILRRGRGEPARDRCGVRQLDGV
ncbi:MAG: hypothetical protein AB7G37_14080 [Solirubrobacteraceae bacterium]